MTGSEPVVQTLGLRDAMTASRAAATRDGSSRFRIGIACSFTPLHLPVLVTAYVGALRPEATVTSAIGTYGDLSVALGDLRGEGCDAVAVVLEWPDLDPRLALRRAGTAGVATAEDMAATARTRLASVAARIDDLAALVPVVVSPPALGFPPYFAKRAGQTAPGEAALRSVLAEFVQGVSSRPNVRVLEHSGPAVDLDLKMHFKADFPYAVGDASELAAALSQLLAPPPPKKGVITDLDDTLWRGLVGEVGPDGVFWDLDSGGQVHGIYQQCLARLAKNGVLVAVVSKNEMAVVTEALNRSDLGLPLSAIFPIQASWQPKSTGVAEVLRAWNIGASDVVMVDDSPLELSEIATAYPDITTLHFDRDNPAKILELVARLDAMFVTDTRSEEDALRVASLRSNAEFERVKEGVDDYADFLRDVQAQISIEVGSAHELQRAFDLVHKTNQFNLNGIRPTPAEWQARSERDGALSMVVRYSDRFGDLGAISILTGTVSGDRAAIDTWVLSCRAFSRAVEHHVLNALATEFGVDVIEFDYQETAKNAPVRRFLAEAGVDFAPDHTTASGSTVRQHPYARIHATSLSGTTIDRTLITQNGS